MTASRAVMVRLGHGGGISGRAQRGEGNLKSAQVSDPLPSALRASPGMTRIGLNAALPLHFHLDGALSRTLDELIDVSVAASVDGSGWPVPDDPAFVEH